MKAYIITAVLFICSVTVVNAGNTEPPVGGPNTPEAPSALQLIQWDLNSTEHFITLEFINPLKADLHLKIYGPQGYLIHVEDLKDQSGKHIGFNLDGMSNGEYKITLESGETLLSTKTVTLY